MTKSKETNCVSKPKAFKRPQKKKTSKADQNWMANYERLKQFKEKNGHTYVPLPPRDYDDFGNPLPNFDFAHRSLANWVKGQCAAKNKGKLRKDREQLLKDIDFYFNPHDYYWDSHFLSIKAIKERVGHVDIPYSKAQLTDGNKVYEKEMAWAEEQRLQYALYSQGLHSRITERRIDKLNEIGFAWSRDEEDSKRIEKKASNLNFSWITRKLKFRVREVLAAMKDARNRNLQTGEFTMATYDGMIVGKEPDGTICLLHPFELDKVAIKNDEGDEVKYSVCAFGEEK